MIKLGTVMPYLKDLQQSQVTHPLSSPDRNRQILLYQEKQKLIAFWYISSNSSSFVFRVFACFLNKYGYNFDDVTKHGNSRPSQNKDILKKGYDVIISIHDVTRKRFWRDSYCRCGPLVTQFSNPNFVRI